MPSTQFVHRSRAALTLMELVVVMGVLAALAAILVPMFPNLLRRAHKATDATQTAEVAKALQLYQGAFVSYPDDFDLLTDGTTFPAYLPTDGGAFGGFVTADNLTTSELKALQRVGIRFLQPLATNASAANFHPTMSPYSTTLVLNRYDLSADASLASGATSTASDKKFAVLSRTAITAAASNLMQTELANDPTARYVVFGVGPRSSMIGQTIQDAPTSVPQKKTFTPDTTYSRVGVVFKVSGVEVARTERARFVTAVALEDDELESAEKDVVGYYEVSRDPRN